LEFVYVPLPNWPELFSPQAYTVPVAVTPNINPSPEDTSSKTWVVCANVGSVLFKFELSANMPCAFNPNDHMVPLPPTVDSKLYAPLVNATNDVSVAPTIGLPSKYHWLP